jgi:glyoxylase-like metal-dependent hydrolase (beta-lactamase superfamily II)
MMKNMRLFAINSGFFKLDGGAMFGVVPKKIWQKLITPDENNFCTWAMRCLLVETGNRLILTDTGIGDKQESKFRLNFGVDSPSALVSEINKAGYSAEEVTDVFLTHLHFDHSGGAVKKTGNFFEPTFKNARYWSNESHWDWANNPNPREAASFLKENFASLQPQLNYLKRSEEFDLEGFDIFFADGHTEKMMLPSFAHKGKKVIFCADLLPSIHHLKPPYVMSYDVRPLLTMEEKDVFLTKACNEGSILMFEHDASHECCTLKRTENGAIVPDEIFALADIK